MAKYIFIAMSKDNGNYKAGDVVSIREEGSKVTRLEEKLFICMRVEMDKAEAEALIDNLRPHHKHTIPSISIDGVPPKQEDVDAVKAMLEKLPVNGNRLNLNHVEIVVRLSDLQSKDKSVPVFDIDKTAIIAKESEK